MDNPQAFSCGDQMAQWPSKGLTMLDYFAGQALAGYRSRTDTHMDQPDEVARDSYTDAEAMLAERQKRTTTDK